MYAQFNRFGIKMTLAQARTASHAGDCEDDVLELLKLPAIRAQRARIPTPALVAELEEYGAWDDEDLQDRAANEKRIIWIAAGNISEEVQRGA